MTEGRTIWKFPVLSTGPMAIDVPGPGTIVLVDRDPATGLMAFWAEVFPNEAKQERFFQVVGTGHDIPDGACHLGSVVMGELVWHLFELPAAALRARKTEASHG